MQKILAILLCQTAYLAFFKLYLRPLHSESLNLLLIKPER